VHGQAGHIEGHVSGWFPLGIGAKAPAIEWNSNFKWWILRLCAELWAVHDALHLEATCCTVTRANAWFGVGHTISREHAVLFVWSCTLASSCL